MYGDFAPKLVHSTDVCRSITFSRSLSRSCAHHGFLKSLAADEVRRLLQGAQGLFAFTASLAKFSSREFAGMRYRWLEVNG